MSHRIERRILVERAEAFADYLDAKPEACAAARNHLLRYAAFRAARQPYCLTNRFHALRHAGGVGPEFERLTRGWSEVSANLLLALTASILWKRASPTEREALLVADGLA